MESVAFVVLFALGFAAGFGARSHLARRKRRRFVP
jgi:hypothetical protein